MERFLERQTGIVPSPSQISQTGSGHSLMRLYMEVLHFRFFPYARRCIDTLRSFIPIAPDYESQLAERIEKLALQIKHPDFEDYVKEVIMKDLFEENPHFRSFEGLCIHTGKEIKFLSLPEKDKKEIDTRFFSYETRKRSLLERFVADWKRKGEKVYRMDVGEELDKLDNLGKKEYLLNLVVDHELIGGDPLVNLLLKVSTELASSGYYDQGIQLIKKAMDKKLVWWDSRQSVLVDQLGKIYFANKDFARSEMCFEEVVRREHWPKNAKPYNFHLGIIEISNKHYERGKDFLLRASQGFNFYDVAKRYDEAVEELYQRIGEKKKEIKTLQ